jgi:hypothetical protein
MRLSDKTLTCLDCAGSFVFTAGEQEMQIMRGRDDEPSRCPRCLRKPGRRQSRRDLPSVYARSLIEP